MASRDHRGRWLRGVEGINRDAAALRLRAEGWSLQRISDQLAYGGKANVSEALTKAKEDIIGPPARDLIAQLGIDAAQKLDATVHQVDQVDVELAELLRDTRARVAVQEAELRPPPDVV